MWASVKYWQAAWRRQWRKCGNGKYGGMAHEMEEIAEGGVMAGVTKKSAEAGGE